MKRKLFLFLFLISVIGVITGILLHIKWLDYISKPLIMISIAGHFLLNSKNVDKKVLKLALIAFLFSLVGDSFLMITNGGVIYFMLGLASFLVAQISYICLFRQTVIIEGREPFLKKNTLYLIGYFIYGISIYILLFNHLDYVLKIAVFVYMLALLSMSAMALNRFKVVNPASFSFVFFGSVLFVISDSIIALNKFLIPIPNDGLFVMSTYMTAQFLIMMGVLKQFE